MKYTKSLLALLSLALFSSSYAENKLGDAMNTTLKSHEESRKSQAIIDVESETTKDLLAQYRATLNKTDSLITYNNQLEKLTTNQLTTIESLTKQLNTIEETQQNIVPLLLRMVEVLEEFIELDTPFLKPERLARLELIKNMMDRPDVTLPDKYRRIMEAYQIEMEYGRTIETLTETIQIGNKNTTVDILRIGRLSLYYQTLDGKESGYWNKQEKRWLPLDKENNPSITKGILIAKKQAPPDLIKLPVSAPEAKQ